MRIGARLFACVLSALAVTATSVAAAAGAGRGSGSRPNSAVEIGTAKIHKLGEILVNGHGDVLYMFQPDGGSKVVCDAACQKIWPPDVAPKAGVAKAIDGARQSLIGSDRNPVDGERIVTYNGWPLYRYVLDTKPRVPDGQNVALNGGFWWVLTPAGRVNQTPMPHGGFEEGS